MLPRERVIAALDFRPPDVLPVRMFRAPGGFNDHGQKLLDLMRACGDDFGDINLQVLPPGPPASDFDADGRYHAWVSDEWGTTWEYRIYGVWGHPRVYPLEDMGKLDSYRMPPVASPDGEQFKSAFAESRRHRQRFYLAKGVGSIFEKMCALRPFESVLMDIADDTPEINRLADRLVERIAREVRWALALEADAVSFGDDFGTQQACIFPPRRWREFFKPRYQALIEPIKRAGRKVLFHSCGQIWDLLEDLREIGVDSIWPQLPVYDAKQLARRCRDLRLGMQIHPDRGDLMQNGNAAKVREYLQRIFDIFDVGTGGSWLHFEIDPNFRWENVEMLLRVVMERRS